MSDLKRLHRFFYVFSSLYLSLVSYEIIGSVLYYERCISENGLGGAEIFKFFAFIITFSFFMIPMYTLKLLNDLWHYQESWARLSDMCQRNVVLGYGCVEFNTSHAFQGNTTTSVKYGSMVYERGF